MPRTLRRERPEAPRRTGGIRTVPTDCRFAQAADDVPCHICRGDVERTVGQVWLMRDQSSDKRDTKRWHEKPARTKDVSSVLEFVERGGSVFEALLLELLVGDCRSDDDGAADQPSNRESGIENRVASGLTCVQPLGARRKGAEEETNQGGASPHR